MGSASSKCGRRYWSAHWADDVRKQRYAPPVDGGQAAPCKLRGGTRSAVAGAVSRLTPPLTRGCRPAGQLYWRWSRVPHRSAIQLEPPVEDLMPMSTHPSEKVLAAPEELGLDSRTAFRGSGPELLAQ